MPVQTSVPQPPHHLLVVDDALDYTDLAEPATRTAFISKAADVPGGLEVLKSVDGPSAQRYALE
ncbi:hypothetical protein ACWCQ1_42390 [Streptomyces sp. NPDC002144]